MEDSFYPTIDESFIRKSISNSAKLETQFEVGSSSVYLRKGNAGIGKRLKILRTSNNGQYGLIYCQALSVTFCFTEELNEWLIENRNWREGGYFEKHKTDN